MVRETVMTASQASGRRMLPSDPGNGVIKAMVTWGQDMYKWEIWMLF